MKTQYYTASSLDGFIATENDSLDWLFQLDQPETSTYSNFIAGVGALVMGSSTYEWLLAHLDTVNAETGSLWPYRQPTWVFSSRDLPRLEGADLRFVRGDVRPIHAEIAQHADGKNLWIVGGGDLAGQFCDAGLLDEIIVQIGSITLGSGKPVFPRRLTGRPFKLHRVQQLGPGMVELRYEVLLKRT